MIIIIINNICIWIGKQTIWRTDKRLERGEKNNVNRYIAHSALKFGERENETKTMTRTDRYTACVMLASIFQSSIQSIVQCFCAIHTFIRSKSKRWYAKGSLGLIGIVQLDQKNSFFETRPILFILCYGESEVGFCDLFPGCVLLYIYSLEMIRSKLVLIRPIMVFLQVDHRVGCGRFHRRKIKKCSNCMEIAPNEPILQN